MSALPQPNHYMTEDEYLAFEIQRDTRHEYVDGEIFAMVGGTWEHSIIISNTSCSLGNQLDDTPCNSVSSDTHLHVSSTKAYRYPDIMVVCGTPQFRQDRRDIVTNPIVLIEVLFPSTIAVDTFEKFQEYKKIPTLQEYILIKSDTPFIMRYIRRENDNWLYSDVSGLNTTLDLPSINCTLKLSDVYKTITFDSDTND